MEFTERLLFLDAVELLSDRLDLLRDEEVIKDAVYNRKKAYKQLMRAVNKADRHIASLNKNTRIVSLFVPKDLHIIPMSKHDTYAGQQVSAVTSSKVAAVHPAVIELQIYDEPWWEVAGIFSEIAVYEKHLLDQDDLSSLGQSSGGVTKLKQTSGSGILAPDVNTYWFDINNRILHLSEKLKADSFLVFEAFVVPSLLDIRDYNVQDRTEAETAGLTDMYLDTPTVYEDILMDVALSKLLPGVKEMPSPQGIDGYMQGLKPGNGAVMFFVDE